MNKKRQLTEQEERIEMEKDPIVQRIIKLVENEGMTAYTIDIERKSEVPMSMKKIRQIIKKCEKYGYIDKSKKEQGIQLRRVQRKGKMQIHNDGEGVPVMYNENEPVQATDLRRYEAKIAKANCNNTDIIAIANQYISVKKYEKALKFVRARHQLNNISISREMEEKLKSLETTLVKACKTQTAIRMLNAGNNNISAISELTTLPKEIVAILKMKLGKEKMKFATLNTREMAISGFLKGKSTYEMQQQFGINDVEIIDIENQARYRQLWKTGKQNVEVKLKQDSKARVIVLATKLGIKKEAIAKVLKLDLEVVEKYIQDALNVKLIKENELNGINLLDYGITSKREVIR